MVGLGLWETGSKMGGIKRKIVTKYRLISPSKNQLGLLNRIQYLRTYFHRNDRIVMILSKSMQLGSNSQIAIKTQNGLNNAPSSA